MNVKIDTIKPLPMVTRILSTLLLMTLIAGCAGLFNGGSSTKARVVVVASDRVCTPVMNDDDKLQYWACPPMALIESEMKMQGCLDLNEELMNEIELITTGP